MTEAAEVLWSALCGLALSVGIECWLRPQPAWQRPWGCWAIHAGIFGAVHGALVLLLGHPWFAAGATCTLLVVLVVVNNAKLAALREPFVFADHAYFTDAIRHPRLFLPFLGWGNALAIAVGIVVAVVLGLSLESVPDDRWLLQGQLGGVLASSGMSVLLLAAGARQRVELSFEPERDLASLGLLGCLWHQAVAARQRPPELASAFEGPVMRPAQLPHLVAVQSESFFDPRPMWVGIRPEVLAEFDRLASTGLAHGDLQLPAWGANTVRSEFAFLSGLDPSLLGAHRFNPYRAVAAGWSVPTVASFLKQLGYRTVCIHPYPASFYQRDQVFPRLGFDEFLDLSAFDNAQRCGPFVSDAAVSERIARMVAASDAPLFVFAITMENHGPLHLEKVAPTDVADLYCDAPPPGCDDLTIYLRHLRNADRMIGELRQSLGGSDRPASLCWFGDHVPSMPEVYEMLGSPVGPTAFALWSTHESRHTEPVPLAAHQLAAEWLRAVGLMDAR